MAKSERRACPACGTLRCIACNSVKRSNASRFHSHDDIKGHNLVMVPVFHRHSGKAEDHEDAARYRVSKGFKVHFPLQGYDYSPE